MITFFSILCTLSCCLFNYWDFKVSQGVAWQIEMVTSGLTCHPIGDIPTVVCQAELEHSLSFSNVHLLAIFFYAINCTNNVLWIAINLSLNVSFFFIHFYIFAFFNVWACSTMRATFAHVLDISFMMDSFLVRNLALFKWLRIFACLFKNLVGLLDD